jgi:hypothetical protein
VLLVVAAMAAGATPALARPAPAAAAADREPPAAGPDTFFAAPTAVRLVAGPWTRLTLLGGSDLAVASGGGGGVLLLDRLLVMGYAAGISPRAVHGDPSRRLELSWLGVQVAWVLAPRSRLNVNVGALVGGTDVRVTSRVDASDRATLRYLSLEPYLELEASLYPGLRLFASGGHRAVLGADRRAGVDRRYLSGPTIALGFRMGG